MSDIIDLLISEDHRIERDVSDDHGVERDALRDCGDTRSFAKNIRHPKGDKEIPQKGNKWEGKGKRDKWGGKGKRNDWRVKQIKGTFYDMFVS